MRYLVTGASGYVGSQFVHHVLSVEPGAEVVAVVRDAAKARRVLPEAAELFVAPDLASPGALDGVSGAVDAIVHCAAITQSRVMVSHPVETADSIVLSTRNVLAFARQRGVRAMVYVSSMEACGALDCSDHRAAEDELGTVELYRARSSYPMGKRMAEQYCFDFFAEYGVPVRVARLAQTFGRGVPRGDGRVFAQFARAAMQGAPIVLHTAGRSMGNYCAIGDVVRAIELLLACGKDGEAYHVVNEAATMTIHEMAELVARDISGGRSRVVIDIPEGADFGYAADTGLRLSGAKLRALGWAPTQGLAEMYREMIADWEAEA